MGKLIIDYFGDWLCDPESGEPNAECVRIANSNVDGVLTSVDDHWTWTGKRNLTPQVVAYLHSKGKLVFGHIDGTMLGWQGEPCSPGIPHLANWDTVVKPEIDDVVAAGCDYVSDGEVCHMLDPADACGNPLSIYYDYFKNYSDYVHSKGLKVLFNTGTWYTGELIMQICDILSLELNWDKFTCDNVNFACPSGFTAENIAVQVWHKNYLPERFAGIMDAGTLDAAVPETQLMWARGIGQVWFAIVPLPSWFEDYVASVKPPAPAPEGCFIATACGTSNPSLGILRVFRDRCLPLQVRNGYYFLSPPFATAISAHTHMKTVGRRIFEWLACQLKKTLTF